MGPPWHWQSPSRFDRRLLVVVLLVSWAVYFAAGLAFGYGMALDDLSTPTTEEGCQP